MRLSLLLLLGFVLSVSTADAQVAPAPFDPDMFQKPSIAGVTYEPARREDYVHGTHMAVTLKDKTSVQGTLVRTDTKNKKLVLRLTPESAPVAYDFNQIETVRRGFAKSKVSPDGIVPAADTGMPIVEPEINKVVIINGAVRTVQYQSSTLSPGEREVLTALEKAENDLAQMQTASELRQSAIEMQVAQQRLALDYQAQINKTVYLYNRSNFTSHPLAFADPDLRTFPPAPLTSLNNFWPANAPAVKLDSLPAANPEELKKARETYQRIMANQTVYEDGKLVAVIADPNLK